MAYSDLYRSKRQLINEIAGHVKDLETIEVLLSNVSIVEFKTNEVLFRKARIEIENVRANLARFARELNGDILYE